MALNFNEKYVKINGQEYIPADEYHQHEKELKGVWRDELKKFIKVNADWYVYVGSWNMENWRKVAGINVIDFAVPQPWFDKHYTEIRKRGGAAWWYDKKGLGEPIFFDEIEAMAMKNIKKHIPSAPATRKPVRRGKR